MDFFLLNEYCYFVQGASKGAIYNSQSEKIFSIDKELSRIILNNQSGKPLKDIQEYRENIDQAKDALSKLVDLGIGKFYPDFIIIEKLSPVFPKIRKKTDKIPPTLSNIFLILNNECNLNCDFCLSNTYKTNRKTGCKLWPKQKTNNKGFLNRNEWKKILHDANRVDCKKVTFLGGEVLLNWELLSQLVKHTRTLGFEQISLYTNTLLFSDEILGFFEEYDVTLNIQVFSNNPRITDKITRSKGYHEILTDNLNKLSKSSIKYNFIYIKHCLNYNEFSFNYFKQYNPLKIEVNSIYPYRKSKKCEDYNNSLYKTTHHDILNNSLNNQTFFQQCEGNKCFDNNLAISNDGRITPCPMAKKEIISNIRNKSIRQILHDEDMNIYWDLSRDKIAPCNNCEFKYFCEYCLPLEKSTNNDGSIYSNSRYCLYNPMNGKWDRVRNE